MIAALCLVLNLTVPAMAANITTAGGNGTTPIALTAAASTFSVTVPTSIAITVNADASVTCPAASAVKITNNSAGTVKVSSISMTEGTWSLVSYNGGDRSALANEAVDSNKLGFQLSVTGDSAATSKAGEQTLAHDAGKWLIAPGESLQIGTAAIATAVSGAITGSVNAANVIFTIGWNTEN